MNEERAPAKGAEGFGECKGIAWWVVGGEGGEQKEAEMKRSSKT